ncbi:MAG: hypothetical protein KBS35_03230 [Mycoplasma sp.]|nr:hypothetical protein [Candidatus Hennigella equi]
MEDRKVYLVLDKVSKTRTSAMLYMNDEVAIRSIKFQINDLMNRYDPVMKANKPDKVALQCLADSCLFRLEESDKGLSWVKVKDLSELVPIEENKDVPEIEEIINGKK